ncbi:MAG TPA: TldD/PmbA family protein [Methanoregulaceae archaeon]|nr:TldD/PmbA family protein [Methanoregulaceae archaeon]
MVQTNQFGNGDLQGLIDDIIRAGQKIADEIEVYIASGQSISAELKKTSTGLATGNKTLGLGIRTIDGGKIGISGTNDPMAWKPCLDAAISSGKLATSQEWKGLPSPEAMEDRPPLSYDPGLRIDADQASELLRDMIDGAGKYAVQVTSGSADLSTGSATIGNSQGILYSSKKTFVSVSLETIRGHSTGYEFDQSTTKITDPARVGEKAAFFAWHGESGDDVKTGAYDIILSPVALSQLLGSVLLPAVNGRNVHAGRSKLAGSLGERILDQKISLFDDPLIPGALGSTYWDAEGVPSRRIDIIREGVLGEFLYDLKTAYRFGKKSTGSAVRSGFGGAPSIGHHNLVLDGPRSAIWYEPAIYVNDVVGAHTANPMSGDFSVEISNPSWVKEDDFGTAIRKVMLAGNVFDMLNSVDGIAQGNRAVGSMLLPEIRFSSQKIIGV